MRANMDQIRQKLTDELFILTMLEVQLIARLLGRALSRRPRILTLSFSPDTSGVTMEEGGPLGDTLQGVTPDLKLIFVVAELERTLDVGRWEW